MSHHHAFLPTSPPPPPSPSPLPPPPPSCFLAVCCQAECPSSSLLPPTPSSPPSPSSSFSPSLLSVLCGSRVDDDDDDDDDDDETVLVCLHYSRRNTIMNMQYLCMYICMYVYVWISLDRKIERRKEKKEKSEVAVQKMTLWSLETRCFFVFVLITSGE